MEYIIALIEYSSRTFNSKELINYLKNIDKNYLTEEENTLLKNLLNKIKKIAKQTNNEEDSYIKEKKEILRSMLVDIDSIKDKNEKKYYQNINKNINASLNKKYDGGKLFDDILNALKTSKLTTILFEKLTDEELYSIYTSSKFTNIGINLNNEKLDKLSKYIINKKDKKAMLIVLRNTSNQDLNYKKIIDYIINSKDVFYIFEVYFSIQHSDTNKKYLLSKLTKLNDKNINRLFIKYCEFKLKNEDKQYKDYIKFKENN